MKKLKMTPKYYHEAYRFDPATNAYIIDVSLDSYDDVYDEWDPSPFKKRDIEDEFDDFIRDSSSDIPIKYNLMIELFLPLSEKNMQKEKLLLEAYDNFYQFHLKRAFKAKQILQKKVLNNLMLAVLFLFLGYFTLPESENILLMVLKEGIFIGGWVFLWEVFTLLFVTLTEQKKDIKTVERLIHAKIVFIYKN